MSDFITSLCESRLFPSRSVIARYTAREIADLLHLYISALAILRMSHETEHWVMHYARHTTRHGTVTKWRNDATDLEILIVAIMDAHVELRLPKSSSDLKSKITLDEKLLLQWLKSLALPEIDRALTRRLFAKIDIGLRITESPLKSIRRLAQEWCDLDMGERRLTMTRLLQLIRHQAPRSELLVPLGKLSDAQELELKNVCDPEAEAKGEDEKSAPVEKKQKSFLASLTKLDVNGDSGYNTGKTFNEEATCGATTAGDIAPVVGAFMPMQRRAPAYGTTKQTGKSKKKPK